jgi:hypothetical protein
MDRVGLASVRNQRDISSASHGSSADLCAALRALPVKMISMHLISLLPQRRMQKRSALTKNQRAAITAADAIQGKKLALWVRSQLPPVQYWNLTASAALRDKLIAELKELNSPDEAAQWAHRIMGSKNRLKPKDAEQVELGFQLRLSTLTTESPNAPESKLRTRRRRGRDRPMAINKTVLTLPVPRRVRDREHVKSVAKQPCLVCGRRPADAHHLRFAQAPALGRKVSDEFTVPLCRGHHREVHRYRDESVWWNKTGIDATAAARVLWLKTHPLPGGVDAVGAKLPNEPNLVSPQ